MTRAADAVIIICGRIGTLNEFTIAYEDKKPLGVLTGTGGMSDMVKGIVEKSYRDRGSSGIIFDSDPKSLLDKVANMIEKNRKLHHIPTSARTKKKKAQASTVVRCRHKYHKYAKKNNRHKKSSEWR